MFFIYHVYCVYIHTHTVLQAVLVVNVASQCGFTDKHYKQMTKAHEIFGKTGKFHILAFPCNQFGGQEPEVMKLSCICVQVYVNVNSRPYVKYNI